MNHKNSVEVVQELRLLGENIDKKFSNKKDVENVKCLVNRKLFSIKKLFNLSECYATIFPPKLVLPDQEFLFPILYYFI